MRFSCFLILLFIGLYAKAQNITTAAQPAQLDIRAAGENSIRITLRPISFKENFPYTPAVVERSYPAPTISLREISKSVKKKVGSFNVEVLSSPLTVIVTNAKGQAVQKLVFNDDGSLSFALNDEPVLGMGEGGPKPQRGLSWRTQPIQFDRRGVMDSMQPRWQSDAYGSRNPVAMLVGTEGWGLFVTTPWVYVDIKEKERGRFIPWKPTGTENTPAQPGQRNSSCR